MNKDWENTDLYKFTSEYQDADIEMWCDYNKGWGFIPFGWIVSAIYMDYEYYFDIDGKLIKTKAR